MQTKNIRVGHGIVVCVPQFNHPIRVAERAAVLDILSDGRLEFGTGRSATWTELGGMDANPDETKETWDEYVRTIPQMWTNERFGYEGRAFKMPSRAVLPKPYQKPHPPMWVAVSSPGTEVDAAERGLGSLGLTFGGFAEQEGKVNAYRRRIADCEPAGAFVNDKVATVNFLYCHPDNEDRREDGQPPDRLVRAISRPSCCRSAKCTPRAPTRTRACSPPLANRRPPTRARPTARPRASASATRTA